MSSLRGPHSPQASLKPSGFEGLTTPPSKFQRLGDKNFQNASTLSRASTIKGFKGFKAIKDSKTFRGFLTTLLRQKGLSLQAFRAKGLKPPQGQLSFFHDFNFKGFYKGLNVYKSSNLSGLKGLRVSFSQFRGAQRLKIPKWTSGFTWVQFFKRLQDFKSQS